jgi:hypothetical protein
MDTLHHSVERFADALICMLMCCHQTFGFRFSNRKPSLVLSHGLHMELRGSIVCDAPESVFSQCLHVHVLMAHNVSVLMCMQEPP